MYILNAARAGAGFQKIMNLHFKKAIFITVNFFQSAGGAKWTREPPYINETTRL